MITLDCSTEGASIGYQIIGKKETPNDKVWNVYTEPVILPKKKKLITKAHRIGYAVSEAVEVR